MRESFARKCDLSTVPVFLKTWQILKNETHVCFAIFYYSKAYMGLFYVV